MIKKGFTLLEVLIVIIIIGILAAIALPQYTKTLDKARSAEAVAQLGALRSSWERRWYDQYAHGCYTALTTANISKLDIDLPAAADVIWDYKVDDDTSSLVWSARKYNFCATYEDDVTMWVAMNATGVIKKSLSLGGSGTGF